MEQNRSLISNNVTFQTKTSEELGRYVVATQDLCKGDIIFQELPLAAAPQKNSKLICPGCFGLPNEECQKCGWPICSHQCPTLDRHALECQVLINKDARSEEQWTTLQDTLMVVRCVRLKSEDKDRWDTMMEMESNWSKWISSPLYAQSQDLLRRIRETYDLPQVSDDEILRVMAILDINAYELKMPEVNIQGCYRLASLPEHSCVPNAFRTTSSDNLILTLRALTDIPKGMHITTTYCDTLWPTRQRQRHVQWSKFFICRCQRCTDPTELGSYTSSILCPDCPVGNISPLTPRLSCGSNVIIKEDEEEEQMWSNTFKDFECTQCGSIFEAKKCESFVLSAEKQLQDLDNVTENKLEEYEEWLEHWTVPPASNAKYGNGDYSKKTSQVCESTTTKRKRMKYRITPLVYLHPNHAISLEACHTSFLLYSAESPILEDLIRKSSLGLHLLVATSTIFPGISMFRGTIMYELAMTKASLLARYLEAEVETENDGNQRNNLKTLAQETLSLLTESLDHLQYESTDQPEGQLFALGLKQLEDLRSFTSEIFPTL